MTSAVLDASALIAVLAAEPGSELVRRRLKDAVVSAVNYSEVLKKALERGGSATVADGFIRNAMIRIIPFDDAQAGLSASLYPTTKHLGLSFADRACLALGRHFNAEVLTSEARMGDAEIGVKVTLIRPAKKK